MGFISLTVNQPPHSLQEITPGVYRLLQLTTSLQLTQGVTKHVVVVSQHPHCRMPQGA